MNNCHCSKLKKNIEKNLNEKNFKTKKSDIYDEKVCDGIYLQSLL